MARRAVTRAGVLDAFFASRVGTRRTGGSQESREGRDLRHGTRERVVPTSCRSPISIIRRRFRALRRPNGPHPFRSSPLYPMARAVELGCTGRMVDKQTGVVTADPNALVRVHSRWDGWQTAEVRLADLDEIHWFQPERAPQPLLHAYVSSGRLAAAGTMLHDGDSRSAPNRQRQRVCVLKRHTIPGLYAALADRARDQRASASSSARVRPWTLRNVLKMVSGRGLPRS